MRYLTRYGRRASVPAVRFPERPGPARGAVAALDVAQAPLDLGRHVGLPVRPGAGHLVTGERLRDAVGPALAILGVVAPAALAAVDVVQAGELGRRAEAERRQQVVRDGLRRAGVRRRRVGVVRHRTAAR